MHFCLLGIFSRTFSNELRSLSAYLVIKGYTRQVLQIHDTFVIVHFFVLPNNEFTSFFFYQVTCGNPSPIDQYFAWFTNADCDIVLVAEVNILLDGFLVHIKPVFVEFVYYIII